MVRLDEIEVDNEDGTDEDLITYKVTDEATDRELGMLLMKGDHKWYLHYSASIPEFMVLDCSLEEAKHAIGHAVLLQEGSQW